MMGHSALRTHRLNRNIARRRANMLAKIQNEIGGADEGFAKVHGVAIDGNDREQSSRAG